MNISLNGNTFSTNKNPNYSINFTGKAVMDEYRGYLVNTNNQWTFTGLNQILNKQNIKIKKLALILESPHKSEYDSNNNPLRPGNGKTGTAINQKISSRVKITSILDPKYVYKVYIMNAIQYQASCYMVLGKLYSRSNTNVVFRKLFSKKFFNLRLDFINRLNAYDPDVIINCCTKSSGLDKTVKNAIKTMNGFNYKCYTSDYHPAKW